MRLAKFLRLPRSEQMLLIRALIAVGLARLVLSYSRFGSVQSILANRSRILRPLNGHSPEQIAWGVTAASRFIPKATCLTLALAGKLLLAQYGYDCDLRVGVAKREANLFGHAGLESGGKIVLGKTSAARFTALG
jgi:hypothetical protein